LKNKKVLCKQFVSFVRLENWRFIGAATQTAVLVVTLATIPVALLWWFTEPILLGLHQVSLSLSLFLFIL
jgi:hypothetical protein